jgi:hypothetical protein
VGTLYIPNDVVVQGNLAYTGTIQEIPRTSLAQNTIQSYVYNLANLRVHDAPQTVLPGTSANDDLGLYGTTFGTDVLYVATYDVKNAGSLTFYARGMFGLPPEYDAGQTAQIRVKGGMKTTVASVTATVDLEAYLSDKFGAVSGSDLVTTAATTINSLTPANKDFTLTATNLAPGEWIDFRIKVAVNDSGTGTAVIAAIGTVEFLLDIRG